MSRNDEHRSAMLGAGHWPGRAMLALRPELWPRWPSVLEGHRLSCAEAPCSELPISRLSRRRATGDGSMRKLLRYLRGLTIGRTILWCYAIWYAVNVALHFDSRPRLWLTSLGLSAIIGTALLISTRSASRGTTSLDGWQIFRLYLMPFCVSSFAALVKEAGYILIFPPSLRENLLGFALMAGFVALVCILKMSRWGVWSRAASPSGNRRGC